MVCSEKDQLVMLYYKILYRIGSLRSYDELNKDNSFIEYIDRFHGLAKKYRSKVPWYGWIGPGFLPPVLLSSKYSPFPVINDFMDGESGIEAIFHQLRKLMSKNRISFFNCIQNQSFDIRLYRESTGLYLAIKSERKCGANSVAYLKTYEKLIEAISMIAGPWQSRAFKKWSLLAYFCSFLLLLIVSSLKFTINPGHALVITTLSGFMLVCILTIFSHVQYVEVWLGLGKGIKAELDWMIALAMALLAYVIFFVKDLVGRDSVKIETEGLSFLEILCRYKYALLPYIPVCFLLVYSFFIISTMKRNRDIAIDWVEASKGD